MAQTVNNLPAMQETQVQSLGQADALEKGNGAPLQYSCPENSMDRGAWRASIHEVTKSWKGLMHTKEQKAYDLAGNKERQGTCENHFSFVLNLASI